MESIQLAAEDVLLFFSGGVVETFQSGFDRSVRTPAAWLGVLVEPRKHDRVRFTVGRTDQLDQVVYGPQMKLSWTDMMFELAAAEEPGVRAFFSQVAQAAGRIGPA